MSINRNTSEHYISHSLERAFPPFLQFMLTEAPSRSFEIVRWRAFYVFLATAKTKHCEHTVFQHNVSTNNKRIYPRRSLL